METGNSLTEAPLVVIVGPTASGKTALAVDLAKRFNGEIIAADSRTIYKEMNIGTAKPTVEEQQGVPHWGLDLVEPGQAFSASDFQSYGTHKIAEIRDRGHVPFLVGGTGLYIDCVIFNYEFGPKPDRIVRQKLENMTLEELWYYSKKHNVRLPENKKNKRYVIRAIEQGGINQKRLKLIDNTIVVGIATNKYALRERISERSEWLFQAGVVDEAKELAEKYGWDNEAMTGNIYRLIHRYIEGELTLSELRQKVVVSDWHLAKRQLTWFKRNEKINWVSLHDGEYYIAAKLAPWRSDVLL